MKMHWKTLLGVVLLALLASSSNAWAKTNSPGCKNSSPSAHNPNCVPEIDASGTLPALALLGGVVALVRERKRRK
jgi:hypothetical protein